MSSVHRQPGRPFYFCAFYDQHGRRHFRSTKTANRKQAERICAAMQKAAYDARLGKLTADRARAIVEEAVADIAEVSGVQVPRQTIRTYLDGWLAAKSATKSTLTRYRGIVDAFLKHLEAKADYSLQALSDADVQTFRDKLAAKVAPGTVNTYLKVIRVALGRAVKKNLLTRSPALSVDKLGGTKHQRQPFTVTQLKKILKAATEEWQTMILVGLYTGLRLSDCANLTAANLNLLEGEITLTEKKTKRTRTLEVAKPLREHLEALDLGDNPVAPLCPTLVGKPETWLSNEFYDLLSNEGLVPIRDHKSTDKGRDSRRTQSPLTFHSLRHTAVSLLKNAGVSDAVARDIIGHESAAVSRVYTHIEAATRRKALNKLPDVTEPDVDE